MEYNSVVAPRLAKGDGGRLGHLGDDHHPREASELLPGYLASYDTQHLLKPRGYQSGISPSNRSILRAVIGINRLYLREDAAIQLDG